MGISLAGWSLHRRFQNEKEPLSLLDFPSVAKEEFGFDAIELNNPFFASTEPAYLDQLLEASKRAGTRLAGMAVDGTGDPSALDEDARQEAVRLIRQWFPVAKHLGLPYFRANTGGHGEEHNEMAVDQCVKSFKELMPDAERHGIRLAIENHWGISAVPDNIVHILQEVDSPWLGTLPDFGNFPDEVRYEGIEKMAPYAIAVHAKMFEFAADGEETRIDILRCVNIIRGTGYEGDWGIEYEGKVDDHAGVLKSKALLERHLLAAG